MSAKTLFQHILVPLQGGRGFHVWKVWCRIGLARRKRQFQQQYPTYFCCNKDLIRAMLPIYYGTSFLTFCQISGLKEEFEKIIRHQTALKFGFQEHASDWPEDFCHPTYAYFSCNRDLCRAILPIYLPGDIFLNFLPSLSLG